MSASGFIKFSIFFYIRRHSRKFSESSIMVEMVRYSNLPPNLQSNSSEAMAKASEVFPGADPDGKVKEIKHWLKTKGVRDFEPVSLFCDQLTKVTISRLSGSQLIAHLYDFRTLLARLKH